MYPIGLLRGDQAQTILLGKVPCRFYETTSDRAYAANQMLFRVTVALQK